MSFNLGGNTGDAQAKPPAFGTFSFGSNATPAPAFGGMAPAPAFGVPTSAPAFGTVGQAAPVFGAPAAQPSMFGTTTAAAPTGFGMQGGAAPAPAFGAPAATGFGATAATGFGGPTATSFGAPAPTGFGAPAPTGFGAPAATGFGAPAGAGFGAPAATGFGAPAATGFGVTGFGAPTTAPAFGFGTQTSAAPALGFGGFGAATTSAPFSVFGAPAATTTTAASGFGGFGAANTGFGGLGAATAATSTAAPFFGGFTSSFGNAFGAKPATAGTGAFGGFGAQQQQQAPPQITAEEAFAQSVFNVTIFGDERDTTIARWNYLQAMWGTGKAFYSQTAAPVTITPHNSLCRFKTIGYSQLPGKKNNAGLVALVFNKSHAQVKEFQQQFIVKLTQILGNKPSLMVMVESVKPLSESKCQLVVYVEEKSPVSNESKKIFASELYSFLNQPMSRNQITSLGVDQIIALVLPDEDQLKEYLETPPKGISQRMWKQAKIDNPDPTTLIPVPVMGFQDLKWRVKCQELETETHHQYLAKVENEIDELKHRYTKTAAKLMEHSRKFIELTHTILKVVVRQESKRKAGVALTADEEIIRSKLENMYALVSAPTQFRGRLNELLSQMRMQRNQWAHSANGNEYKLDEESAEEIRVFLTMQQKAMSLLIDTVNQDMKDIKIMSNGVKDFVKT